MANGTAVLLPGKLLGLGAGMCREVAKRADRLVAYAHLKLDAPSAMSWCVCWTSHCIGVLNPPASGFGNHPLASSLYCDVYETLPADRRTFARLVHRMGVAARFEGGLRNDLGLDLPFSMHASHQL